MSSSSLYDDYDPLISTSTSEFSFTPYAFDFEDKLSFDPFFGTVTGGQEESAIPKDNENEIGVSIDYHFDFDSRFSGNLHLGPLSPITSGSGSDSGLDFHSPRESSSSSSSSVHPSTPQLPFTNFLFPSSPFPPIWSQNNPKKFSNTPPAAETALSPLSTTTPSLISPRSSFGGGNACLLPPSELNQPSTTSNFVSSLPPAPIVNGSSESDAAEALSHHHLQRYLHYKALAAQAEAEAQALAQSQSRVAQYQSDQFGALLANCDLNIDFDLMPRGNVIDHHNNDNAIVDAKPTSVDSNGIGNGGMLVYNPNLQQSQFFNVIQQQQSQQQPSWSTSNAPIPTNVNTPFASYQAEQQAALHRAQAQAHIQAHESALRLVHSRPQSQSLSQSQTETQTRRENERFTNFYMPLTASRGYEVDQAMSNNDWSSDNSTVINVKVAPHMASATYSSSSTTTATSFPAIPQVPSMSIIDSYRAVVNEAETEPQVDEDENDDDDEGDEETSEYQGDGSRIGSPSLMGDDEEVKPKFVTNGGLITIPNLHGGGRGYVPGKTPDDPKKRHKCKVCGRGFARAFNLKSHAQTHNPTRPKPFQCPHTSCKRGFSRLHDLERHRQGIHSDGPLVDAKLNNVAPSVARAQHRIQRRAERGAGLV